MSPTPSTAPATTTSAATPPRPGPIPLACPTCQSADHLRTVEIVEVLVDARFFLGNDEPDSGDGSQLLADTQHWQSDGAIVCRNCDQVDLHYGDLIPAITLTNPRPAERRAGGRPHPGRHVMTTTTAQPNTTQPYIAALRAGDLFADRAYQRDLDATRVERMSGEFDRTLLGVLEVSAREDGRYAIIDGQHRWGVVRTLCGDDEHLVCQVHTGLTPGDEARLFLEIDTGRRNLTWWDRWRARRGKGDPNVLAIDEVLTRHGLQVNPAPADGHIRATKALETIVDDLGDLQMLDNVLIVLTAAFGIGFDTFDGGIMQGVALVLGHYDADELDTDRLVVQLRTISPRQLRSKAVALREAHRGTVPRLCAAVVVERYNAGRGRKVEDFFTRVPSVSKAGAAFNRTRRERAAIRRWANRHGYDIGGARNIPPIIRQAYEKAQVEGPSTAKASGQSPTPSTEDHGGGGQDDAEPARSRESEDDDEDGWGDLDEDGSPEVGVPDRDGVLRALANGKGLRWVMDAYGLDYPTAKALRDEGRHHVAA